MNSMRKKVDRKGTVGAWGTALQLKAGEAGLPGIHDAQQAGRLATLSAIANGVWVTQRRVAPQRGLPNKLKEGIEGLSGIAMDDVRVHYNSSKPAQLQAHAYAQGSEIHIAPGQEKHLAHEAWHVVQQKQGRVKPTLQLKGVSINDDHGLEREADVMGAKAVEGVHGGGAPVLHMDSMHGGIPQLMPIVQRAWTGEPLHIGSLDWDHIHTFHSFDSGDSKKSKWGSDSEDQILKWIDAAFQNGKAYIDDKNSKENGYRLWGDAGEVVGTGNDGKQTRMVTMFLDIGGLGSGACHVRSAFPRS